MKSTLIHLIVNRPLLIILAVIVVTAIFGFGLRHGLALNVSPLLFVEAQSQEREDYNRARASFGDDLFMVVACVSDDAFAPNNLAKLRALHQQIAAFIASAQRGGRKHQHSLGSWNPQ